MLLIADSGSTKTDWVLIEDKKNIRELTTLGLNPFFETTQTVYEKLADKFTEKEKSNVREVYFYGAGCIRGVNSYVLENALNQLFPNAKVDANDDMLGAARALFGNQSGIACILGTGANSCKFENGEITDKVPTLGYILGDEGSGAYLGRKLINHYFKRKLPSNLASAFEKKYNPVQVDIQNAVYKQPNPNRFLASFVPFLKENIENSYVKNFMTDSFDDFFDSNILRYQKFSNFELGFIGSVAFHFSTSLKEVAQKKNLKVSTILKKPIESLIDFHSK